MTIIFSYKLFAKMILSVFLSFLLLLATVSTTTQAQNPNALLEFNKDLIISDSTFTSYIDFPNEGKVQEYLNKKQSILASYFDKEKNLTAAQIIFRASNGELTPRAGVTLKISPALMLTMLEKEQSLISTKSYDIQKDPARKMASAMGYGCYDGQVCRPEFDGFFNQVLWGAFQLKYNFENANNPRFLPYNINSIFNTQDKHRVKIANAATASLYRYTPHVFHGNYNVFKIMTANGWTVDNLNTTVEHIDVVNNQNQSVLNCDEVFKIRYTFRETNNRVENLQRCLTREKLFTHPITNHFGPLTRDALIRYYTRINSCSRFLYQDFRIGRTGPEIHALQRCLIDRKLFPLKNTTGFYGRITDTAFRRFKL